MDKVLLFNKAKSEALSLHDTAKILLDFVLRTGDKLSIKDTDSIELMKFKEELLYWMNKEMDKINERIGSK